MVVIAWPAFFKMKKIDFVFLCFSKNVHFVCTCRVYDSVKRIGDIHREGGIGLFSFSGMHLSTSLHWALYRSRLFLGGEWGGGFTDFSTQYKRTTVESEVQ